MAQEVEQLHANVAVLQAQVDVLSHNAPRPGSELAVDAQGHDQGLRVLVHKMMRELATLTVEHKQSVAALQYYANGEHARRVYDHQGLTRAITTGLDDKLAVHKQEVMTTMHSTVTNAMSNLYLQVKKDKFIEDVEQMAQASMVDAVNDLIETNGAQLPANGADGVSTGTTHRP